MNTPTVENPTVETLKKDLKELDSWRTSLANKLTQLETMGQAELKNKLANLPAYLGVSTMEEAVGLVKKARKEKLARADAVVTPTPVKNNPASYKPTWGRGKKIPNNVKADVITLLKSNKYTTAEISSRMKISTAAINNIKKVAGLVHERSVLGS